MKELRLARGSLFVFYGSVFGSTRGIQFIGGCIGIGFGVEFCAFLMSWSGPF